MANQNLEKHSYLSIFSGIYYFRTEVFSYFPFLVISKYRWQELSPFFVNSENSNVGCGDSYMIDYIMLFSHMMSPRRSHWSEDFHNEKCHEHCGTRHQTHIFTGWLHCIFWLSYLLLIHYYIILKLWSENNQFSASKV